MDEIINVSVNGNTLAKDNSYAGVQGEANSTRMRISFSENWSGYAKTITFWDALGQNPVKIILGTNLLEDILVSELVYLVPIPGEAMTEAGENCFVIQGYIDGKIKRTVEAKLKVKPSRQADDAGEPEDVTPTQAEQLQAEIDDIADDIAEMHQLRGDVEAARNDAIDAKDDAYSYALRAESAKSTAEEVKEAVLGWNDTAAVVTAEVRKYAAYANEAKTSIENMTVSSENIGVGEDATVEKTVGDVVNLHFGIPKGEPGIRIGEGAPPDDVVADEDVKAWIDLNGDGDEYPTKAEMNRAIEALAVPSYAFVNILGGSQNWTAEDVTDSAGNVIGCRYGQTVNVNNAVITKNSKVDLLITSEQMVVFYEKDLAFVTENDDGVVTVYCVGNIPEHDYKIQAIVTEVVIDG